MKSEIKRAKNESRVTSLGKRSINIERNLCPGDHLKFFVHLKEIKLQNIYIQMNVECFEYIGRESEFPLFVINNFFFFNRSSNNYLLRGPSILLFFLSSSPRTAMKSRCLLTVS